MSKFKFEIMENWLIRVIIKLGGDKMIYDGVKLVEMDGLFSDNDPCADCYFERMNINCNNIKCDGIFYVEDNNEKSK